MRIENKIVIEYDASEFNFLCDVLAYAGNSDELSSRAMNMHNQLTRRDG